MQRLPRVPRLLAGAGAAVLVLSGCSAFGDDAEGTQVATAFYPLTFVAERIAGDLATVTNLTTPGTEPHDLELTIKETAAISRADLVVHEQGLQPAVDDAVAQNAAGVVIDAAEVVGLKPFTDTRAGDPDPHFWLDPLRMADLGDAVADALGDLDPDHADDFAAGASALRADLATLDRAFSDGLSDCARSTIVVSHDAFGYLDRYGVVVAPVAGLSPDSEPTPAALGDLQQLITDEQITTVFSERLASPRLTQTLAADTGLTTAVLDPIEGLTDETGDDDYLSLMGDNLTALRRANGCR